ncbi:rRNA biogenesis protein Rrp36 [Malassezia pachydermatis]
MSRATRASESSSDTDDAVASSSPMQAYEQEDEVSDVEDEGPGYAQFIDPEDEDEDEVDDESEAETDEADDSDESDEEDALRRELEAVPFDKLLKARRTLKQAQRGGRGNEGATMDLHQKRELAKQQLREMRATKASTSSSAAPASHDVETRETKNAPAVMSSRRPVSRRRNVVEPIQRAKARDPRFDSLSAGPVNLDLHAKSYKFLPDMYHNEIKSLRDTYGKLKRMEAHHAGPRAKSAQALQIRSEREKVELALRRAESQNNERVRRERERSVKSEFKKENQRRVDAGLKPYFPKRSEIQEAVLRKKFEGLAGSEGKSAALRKAMDRKRKKDSQRDKKSLDAALGGGARTDQWSSRRSSSDRTPPPRKRGRRG